MNIIRIAGIMLAILLFLTFLIVINVRKSNESQKSTLMRIMTNYLQVVSTALAVGGNYPSIITDLFLPVDSIGSSSKSLVSLDCFIEDSEMNAFAPTPEIFKLFLTTFVPLALILLFIWGWIILFLISKIKFGDIKRNIVVSVVVILFLLHPALTRSGLSIFQCVKAGEDESGPIYRARVDLNMGCYSDKHLTWIAIVGLPNAIIWGIGIPVAGLAILLKNKKSLGSLSVQKYFLMLYQGLKQDRFYWELINTLRKILLLSIATLMSTFSFSYRAMSGTIVLIIVLRVQVLLAPYKLELNNQLEFSEISTGAYTLLASIIFNEENKKPTIDLIVFIIMIILNIKFLFTWTYWMLLTERERFQVVANIVGWMEVLLCKKQTQEDVALIDNDDEHNERDHRIRTRTFKKFKLKSKRKNKKSKKTPVDRLGFMNRLEIDSVSAFDKAKGDNRSPKSSNAGRNKM